ncbi:MAG: hypothetical protein Q4C47_02485 [Planctomycetia bacterium]|nr:hypothetical protein [Planctomycetia bacterium]
MNERSGTMECDRRERPVSEAWNSWEWSVGAGTSEIWTQRLTRSRSGNGLDRLDGWLRIEMPAERRVVPLHLPVFPPMTTIPILELEPESGPEVEITVVATFRQGIRLEIRRPGNISDDEELILHLELVAGVHDD